MKNKRMITCPIDGCIEESETFINLVRHMVEKQRHLPFEHQGWLEEALGVDFAQYAFKNDRKIANLFAKYCKETNKELPNDPTEFYTWYIGEIAKQKRRI